MENRKQRNILPRIRRFVDNMMGENYWFSGCGRFVMEALGEDDLDYYFFSGLTGDSFVQVYPFDRFRGDCVSDFLLSDGHAEFMTEVFARIGYSADFVLDKRVKADKDGSLNRILDYIDRGVPVISNLEISGKNRWLVFVGYENFGETLLFMTDNMTEPERVAASEVFAESAGNSEESRGLIFVGERFERKDRAQIYRDSLSRLPALMTIRTPRYCSGPDAFRAWADEIEDGRYDAVSPEEFERDRWYLYDNYVCILATNGTCCHDFLDRALELNPDLTFIPELHRLYSKMANMWEKDADGLNAIGGGFNATLDALRDKGRRATIAAKIREFADRADEVLAILRAAFPDAK